MNSSRWMNRNHQRAPQVTLGVLQDSVNAASLLLRCGLRMRRISCAEGG